MVVTGCQCRHSYCNVNLTTRNLKTKRDEGTEPGAQHCPNLTSQLIVFSVGYQLKMTRNVGMLRSTKLVHSIVRKNLHKRVHSMTTGQIGRNNAQIHCTTASGTLTSNKIIPVAFRRSTEVQTAMFKKAYRKTYLGVKPSHKSLEILPKMTTNSHH